MPNTGSVQEEAPTQVAGRLASQYALAADVLIDSAMGWAGALIICCGVDAFAALYAGSAAQSRSGSEDFVSFTKKYMPVFRPPPPEAGRMRYADVEGQVERAARNRRFAWTSAPRHPVDSCAEVLYRGYRCGLVHEGLTAPGFIVVERKGPIFVVQIDELNGQVAYRMYLNVRPFRDCFLEAIAKYAEDLEQDQALLACYRQRRDSITGPQWTLTQS